MSRSIRRIAIGAAMVLAAGALTPLAGSSAGAATADELFTPDPSFQPGGGKVRVLPEEYSAVRVDLASVRQALAAAPGARRSTATMEFRVPTPDGGSERFEVQRTQRMQPKLAAAHPEISTYAGRSLDHPGTTIALDITPMGFHASVLSPEGQAAWYVDPVRDQRGTTEHLSYYGGSVPQAERDLVERVAPEIERRAATRSDTDAAQRGSGLVEQRIYRLALVSDPTYADYFGTENVLAQKVTLINRVNQIYNDDLAIELRLVEQTDELNFDTEEKASGSNGSCGSNPCFEPGQLNYCGPALGRMRTVLGQLVGASSYDVGHLILGIDGGGVAALGVIGGESKSAGCTGIPQPTGDVFAVDYVSHELGHQFNAQHTFSGELAFCGSYFQRQTRTSVEPGSGSSVMAYAGICGQDDLQPHTDPYFSQRTIDEVRTFVGTVQAPIVEVQTVSLRGFDADGESITLGYPGATSVTVTRGTDYTRAGIRAAVEGLTGKTVTVRGWGFDTDDALERDTPDDAGFQVIFAGDPDPATTASDFEDMSSLSVASTSAGVSGFVGETTRGGVPDNGGSTVLTTVNHAPVVRAPANRTIPRQTPFTLTGSGTDQDGDELTYVWEQNDRGGSKGIRLRSNRKKNGPLFRIFGDAADVSNAASHQSPSPGQNNATGSPSRTFPDLKQVLAGNTNAKTGKCPTSRSDRGGQPTLDCFSEFLPRGGYVGTPGSGERAMNFRLTARDSRPLGGGVGHDDVKLRIASKRGPFLVTSHSTRTAVRGGERQRITWDVNRTKKLAHRVRILLSTNGGKTWSRVLAKSTRNDGVKKVRWPNVKTRRARIKIEAVGNYFFDLNDKGFRIR